MWPKSRLTASFRTKPASKEDSQQRAIAFALQWRVYHVSRWANSIPGGPTRIIQIIKSEPAGPRTDHFGRRHSSDMRALAETTGDPEATFAVGSSLQGEDCLSFWEGV